MNALQNDIRKVMAILEYQSDISDGTEVSITQEVLNKFAITERDFRVALRYLLKKEISIEKTYEYIDGEIPSGPEGEIEFFKLKLPKKFSKLIDKYSTNQGSDFSFNLITGVGYLKNKRFVFKTNTKIYSVFSELYSKLNKRVSRGRILSLMHFYDNNKIDPDNSRKEETYAINKIAVKIRSKTGLTTEELVMNNGNLTLNIQTAQGLIKA